MHKSFLLLFLLFSTLQTYADIDDSTGVVTYGDLMIAEDDFSSKRHNQVSISLGYESGNPLLDTYNVSLFYDYLFSDFFKVGVLARSYFGEKTALLDRVEQDFGLLGVDINTEETEFSYYVTTTVTPLIGRLNFFAYRTVLYSLSVRLGLGNRHTKNDNDYAGYLVSIDSQVFLSQRYALLLQISQEAEAAFNSRKTIHRNQLNLGLVANF